MTRLSPRPAAAILVALLGLVHPAAGSDLCSAATVLLVPGSATGSTAGFTADGAASCGQSAASPDAWYRFTAPDNCTLRVDTCGSGYDTVLSIHTACPGSVANQLGCNDDFCTGGGGNLGSTVVFQAAAGQEYYARVSGYNGASGPFMIQALCEVAAPIDTCALAADVGLGSHTGSTQGATPDGSSSCGQTVASNDHWYRFTPTEPGIFTADTCGSGYDTVLSLHTGCPGSAANELACNDDACANLGSLVQAVAEPGEPILVRVSGWNGASGPYTLNLSMGAIDSADDCGQAIEITDGSLVGSALGATPDGAAACDPPGPYRDVWYRYTSPAACTLLLTTCGAPPTTVVSVHSACPGDAANQLACAAAPCGDDALTVPLAADQAVYIRVADFSAQGSVFNLTARCASEGADVFIGELSQFQQFGRVGDTVGCAIDTPVCNAGTEPFDWFVNPDPRHPFMTYNLYRLRAGRFEQIGMSWVKHGYAAAQGNACGLGCTPFSDGTRLGVGCSDTYGAGLNAQQSLLAPRDEVDAWTGAFDYSASHLSDPDAPAHSPISHRLQVRDADLDPGLNAGAQYFAEVYVFGHDDANHMNSVAHEPVFVTGAPGATWNFNIGAAATAVGPAVLAWPGAERTTIALPDASDGRCILAAKVTDNGDGTWRYEYALYNHDLARGVRSFRVPLRPGIAVTNVGFSAVLSHDEGYSNAAWAAVRTGGALTWSTGPLSPSGSNPLRWNTLYNFRFDADAPPQAGSAATLGLYRPGVINTLHGGTSAPAGLCPADVDLDGVVTSSDISQFLTAWLSSVNLGTLDGDFSGDLAVNSADISAFLSAWLAGVQGGC